jgi:UDP-2,4-diacetamido-2,4,6-trideoxy-beta-L-altropyranose hydrolase
MNVAFRVDAAREMGTGHFMRCLCLADELARRDAAIHFLSRRLPDHLRAMLAQRGFAFTRLEVFADAGSSASGLAHAAWLDGTQAADAEACRQALGAAPVDWIVVDHYALDERWEGALRIGGSRVLAIDDLADRVHACDVLLDQNLYTDAAGRYQERVPAGSQLLLGPRYALLRQEFSQARVGIVPRTGPIQRVLIGFGGVDDANRTAAAILALVESEIAPRHVDVVIGLAHPHRADIEAACAHRGYTCHVETTEMARLLAAADLAIGAGGISTWERCCLGVPALALVVAPNQQAVVDEAAAQGLLYAPDDADRPSSLATHLRALAGNARLRHLLSRNGLAAVDGRGASRVGGMMEASALCMREANLADAQALFEWRNHDAVRGMSRRPDPIAWPEHEAWLRRVLDDRQRPLLIGERAGRPEGVVRFDIDGPRAEVSIYRVPGSSQPGLGVSLLIAAETWLRARHPHVAAVSAEVLDGNERSRRLFEAGGYVPHSTVYEKSWGPHE